MVVLSSIVLVRTCRFSVCVGYGSVFRWFSASTRCSCALGKVERPSACVVCESEGVSVCTWEQLGLCVGELVCVEVCVVRGCEHPCKRERV